MAKRYTGYEEVPEGYFKPPGTLGSHHCTVVLQGDSKVAVGSVAGRVTLKPGDTLGYDCGTIWLVPKPESYRDPIRRVLARGRVSQNILKYSADPVEYMSSWQDTSGWPKNSSADPSTGESVVVFGDHEAEDLEGGDYGQRYRVTGGDAIVVREVVGRETTTCRRRRVTRVVVRPTADKAVVAEFLFEELVPEGQERRHQRENRKWLLAEIGHLLISQGMEIPGNEELARITDLYQVVARSYYHQKTLPFKGRLYQLSWHNHYYTKHFFWKPVVAPQWGNEGEQAEINFVAALRSGLLEAWVEAAKAIIVDY